MEDIVIKFCEFCHGIKKSLSPAYENKAVFVGSLLKALKHPKYLNYRNEEDSNCRKLFDGDLGRTSDPKLINPRLLSQIPQPIDFIALFSFFVRAINKRAIAFAYQDLNIAESYAADFDVFCHACSIACEKFFTQIDVTEEFCDFYRNAIEGPLHVDNEPDALDYDFIEEMKGRCPFCEDILAPEYKGRHIKNYEIVHIYPNPIDEATKFTFQTSGIYKPSDVEASSNKIAVCARHYRLYHGSPNVEDYELLYKTKREAIKYSTIDKTMDKTFFKERITRVADYLLGHFDGDKKPLTTEAKRIDEKMKNTIPYSRNRIKKRIADDYYDIDSCFTSYEEKTQNGSTVFGEKIKNWSDHYFYSLHLSEDEVINQIATKLNDCLPDGQKDPETCYLITCYFLVHCEVLSDETSE